VESPGRKELAQVQWLEHDLIAKVVSTFGVHALEMQLATVRSLMTVNHETAARRIITGSLWMARSIEAFRVG
jgi:hypothetical protein